MPIQRAETDKACWDKNDGNHTKNNRCCAVDLIEEIKNCNYDSHQYPDYSVYEAYFFSLPELVSDQIIAPQKSNNETSFTVTFVTVLSDGNQKYFSNLI